MGKTATIILCLFIGACTMTEHGMVVGVPDYEKRSLAVSALDLQILLRAYDLLIDEAHWSRGSSRECAGNVQRSKHGYINGYDTLAGNLSLYCALEQASIEVTGVYLHRMPALQEVRSTIADMYPLRWEAHRLADFNAHPETTFNDVKNVLTITIERVHRKLQAQTPQQKNENIHHP